MMEKTSVTIHAAREGIEWGNGRGIAMIDGGKCRYIFCGERRNEMGEWAWTCGER
jgi:hypothetical protein